jgi:hypothetical protein
VGGLVYHNFLLTKSELVVLVLVGGILMLFFCCLCDPVQALK